MNRYIIITYLCLTVVLMLFLKSGYSQQVQQIDPEYRMGLEYEQMGDFNHALEIFQRLLAVKPGFPPYEQAVERNLKNLKRYNELTVIYKDQFAKNPTDINLLGKIADLYVKWGKIDTAQYYFGKILEQGKNNPFLYSFLANILIQNRMFNEAITFLQDARKKLNDPDLFHYDLAQLYGWYRNYTASVEEYLQIISKDPNSYALIQQEMLNFPNDSATVSQVLNVLSNKVAAQPGNMQYRQLIANYCLRIGKYDLSFRHFIELDKTTNGGGNQVLQFAALAFQQEAYQDAIEAYNYAIEHHPKNPKIIDAEFGLARSYEQVGIAAMGKQGTKEKSSSEDPGMNSLTQAVERYRQIINKNPDIKWVQESYYRIGEIEFFQVHDNDEALKAYTAANHAGEKSPTGRLSLLRIGDCYVARGDLKEALETYRLATRDEKLKDAVYYQASLNLAEVRFYDGRVNETKLLVDSLLTQIPLSNEIYNDLLTLSLFLEDHVKQDSIALIQYARGEFMVKQRHLSEAAAIFQGIIKQNPEGGLDDDCLFQLGELETQTGHPEDGIKEFQNLIDKHPDSYLADRALKRIGEIYAFSLHRSKDAAKTFETFLERFPKSILVDDVRREIRGLKD